MTRRRANGTKRGWTIDETSGCHCVARQSARPSLLRILLWISCAGEDRACTLEPQRRYREIPTLARGIMPGISNRTMARVESWQMTLHRYTRKWNSRLITLNRYASARNSRLVQNFRIRGRSRLKRQNSDWNSTLCVILCIISRARRALLN